MAFHCRCGVKEAECDYPNCKNGEWDARKSKPDVLSELCRQSEAEGWTPEHDDRHGSHELAEAAGIDLMQPKEVADIVCGRLQWVDDELLNALKKRCYILSESHLSGYRLILGFKTLDDVHEAHQQIVKSRAIRPREVQSTKGRG